MMGEVEDWERLGFRLEIPESLIAEVMQKSSTEGDKCRTLGQYWVNNVPNPSWERLAWTLYYSGEENAAAIANQYLPKGMTGAFLEHHIGVNCMGLCCNDACANIATHCMPVCHTVCGFKIL